MKYIVHVKNPPYISDCHNDNEWHAIEAKNETHAANLYLYYRAWDRECYIEVIN